MIFNDVHVALKMEERDNIRLSANTEHACVECVRQCMHLFNVHVNDTNFGYFTPKKIHLYRIQGNTLFHALIWEAW